MKGLGTLNTFEVAKIYAYGLKNFEKTVNGVTYGIEVDLVHSGERRLQSGKKVFDPKKITYAALVGPGISDRTIRSNFPKGAVRLSGAWLLDLYSGMVVYRPNL